MPEGRLNSTLSFFPRISYLLVDNHDKFSGLSSNLDIVLQKLVASDL
jgi:hypothetical protein